MPHPRSILVIALLVCATCLPLMGQVPRAAPPVATIPFELHRNKILVPVTVAGSEPLTFILDTGSPVTVLTSHAAAAALGLPLRGGVRVRGAGTEVSPRSSITGPVPIAVGSVALDTARVVVIEIEESLASASGRRYQGIIGRLLFERYVVRLDFGNGLLELYEPSDYTPPVEAEVLALRLEGGHPHIDTRTVLLSGDTVALDLVVDTGAKLSLALDIGPGVPVPDGAVEAIVGHGANGPVPGRLGWVAEVSLGGAALTDVATAFVDDALRVTPGADGNLGVGSLKRFDVTFDYPNRRMVVVPTARLALPFPVDLSGITLRAAGEDWLEVAIGWIAPGSAAAAAGIEVGDTVLAVDGDPSLTLEQIEARLERPGPVRIALRRGTTLYRAELDLRPLR